MLVCDPFVAVQAKKQLPDDINPIDRYMLTRKQLYVKYVKSRPQKWGVFVSEEMMWDVYLLKVQCSCWPYPWIEHRAKAAFSLHASWIYQAQRLLSLLSFLCCCCFLPVQCGLRPLQTYCEWPLFIYPTSSSQPRFFLYMCLAIYDWICNDELSST